MKTIVYFCAVYALLLCSYTVRAEVEKDDKTDQTTESPIADLALLDAKVDKIKTDSAKGEVMTLDKLQEEGKADSQQHTIADFIIHPLIALKPRLPEAAGKQADASSTTPSPWQLFGFNAGQGLGSSVSSLAGSVTGWLGNRIQLPGLVDTPVRESSTTSTSTTTTPRPEVVVRVKQRGSTKKPLISIKGDDERPYRKTKRPNRFNVNRIEDSEEENDEDFYDDEEEDNFNNQRKRYQNNDEEEDNDDEEDDEANNEQDDEYEVDDEDENTDDEEEEEEVKPIKQNHRRRNPRPLNQNNNNRRRNVYNNHSTNQRRRLNSNNNNNSRKRHQQQHHQESEEVAQYDDDEDDEEANQNEFYYNKNQASKRSQTEQNFIQRGQQTLLKQIKQFTGGQTPAEVGQKVRKSPKSSTKKRRNQATLIINRNGQAIYVAPELLQVTDTSNGNAKPATQQISLISTTQVKRPSSHYPQPPLTIPYRRKGKPTQYITIPWSQLGISPPDQLNALSDGVQSQPLILNIPQNAIDSMQYPKPGKNRPSITPEAVPLLAEASIMDIFKPPRIPAARTPSSTKPPRKVNTSSSSGTPVVIATKTKNGPTRIRPATIVEKAPAEDINMDDKMSAEEALDDDDDETSQVIVVGDESGQTQQLSRHAYKQILEYFNSRTGRQLKQDEAVDAPIQNLQNHEQLIPVKVILDEKTSSETPKIDDKMDAVTEMPLEMQNQAKAVDIEAAVENATESPTNV